MANVNVKTPDFQAKTVNFGTIPISNICLGHTNHRLYMNTDREWPASSLPSSTTHDSGRTPLTIKCFEKFSLKFGTALSHLGLKGILLVCGE